MPAKPYRFKRSLGCPRTQGKHYLQAGKLGMLQIGVYLPPHYCPLRDCSEMLVNLGAQACVGQLQDTVLLRNVCKYLAGQAAPSCSEMELKPCHAAGNSGGNTDYEHYCSLDHPNLVSKPSPSRVPRKTLKRTCLHDDEGRVCMHLSKGPEP